VTDSYEPPEVEVESDDPESGTGTDDEEKPGTDDESQATITITDIRTDLVGKIYIAGLFPDGTSLEDMFGEGGVLALAYGEVSGAIVSIALVSTTDGEPWNASNSRYVLGLFIIANKLSEEVDYAGFATVTLTNQKGVITFSRLQDVTDEIPPGIIFIPDEPGTNTDDEEKPGTGGGDLDGATSWGQSQWEKWFDTHPATDTSNLTAVLEFMAVNSSWVAGNSWWSPLYILWGTGDGDIPAVSENGTAGPVFSRLRRQWLRSY
jgi:hypothetical protein